MAIGGAEKLIFLRGLKNGGEDPAEVKEDDLVMALIENEEDGM